MPVAVSTASTSASVPRRQKNSPAPSQMNVRGAPGGFSSGAFFVVVAMALAVSPGRADAAACELPGPGETARVARVIDGDTLALADGRHVRMLGINAPELAMRAPPLSRWRALPRRHSNSCSAPIIAPAARLPPSPCTSIANGSTTTAAC